VDPSSDSGRDEYGLPPVDIEIPDDARDLERDIQAYHRELRVRRRRARLHRLAGPLVRHGMVVPLVAICLALTLLSGTLLTVVTGRQDASPPAATASPARSAAAATRLPDAPVTRNGKRVSLRTLVPAVLAWVPQPCSSCLAALKRLARQAAQAHVHLYLVGTARAAPGLPELASEVGQPSSQVLNDTTNAIVQAYSPVGLTAIMARSDGTVGGVIRGLQIADPKVTGPRVAAALPTPASPSPVAGQGTPSAAPSQPAPQAT
jgi:hypothetical protein